MGLCKTSNVSILAIWNFAHILTAAVYIAGSNRRVCKTMILSHFRTLSLWNLRVFGWTCRHNCFQPVLILKLCAVRIVDQLEIFWILCCDWLWICCGMFQVALKYVKKLGVHQMRVLTLAQNRGKGGAVRLVRMFKNISMCKSLSCWPIKPFTNLIWGTYASRKRVWESPWCCDPSSSIYIVYHIH